MNKEEFVLRFLDKEEIKNCTMYIVRIRKNGTLGIARPCEYCYSMLTNLSLKGIIYSVDNDFKQEIL